MTTTNKGFTLFEQGQVNPDVLLNEMLYRFESIVNSNPIDKDLTTPPGSESDFDLYIVKGAPYAIDSFVSSTKTIVFEADYSSTFTTGKIFTVKSSTSNNGQFTVVSSSGANVVVSESVTDEASDSNGIAYIAGSTWNGHVDDLAIYYNGTYYFATPLEGYMAFVKDEDLYYAYDGSDWGVITGFISASGANFQFNPIDTATRDALSPSAGWVICNSDVGNRLQIYDGSQWQTLLWGTLG